MICARIAFDLGLGSERCIHPDLFASSSLLVKLAPHWHDTLYGMPSRGFWHNQSINQSINLLYNKTTNTKQSQQLQSWSHCKLGHNPYTYMHPYTPTIDVHVDTSVSVYPHILSHNMTSTLVAKTALKNAIYGHVLAARRTSGPSPYHSCTMFH